MFNQKELVLTTHTKFCLYNSNINGLLLGKVLIQNEKTEWKNEKTKGRKKEGRKRGRQAACSHIFKRFYT